MVVDSYQSCLSSKGSNMSSNASPSNGPQVPDFSAAKDECDLVMKGGITSGVVYPPAVLALAEKYRFRSIGGTSAGAIAAALTAAAESNRNGGGFERLKDISEQLGEGTFLLDLFQPSQTTKPLLRSLLALMQLKPSPGKGFLGLLVWFLPRLFMTLLRHDLPVLLMGAAVGGAVALLLAWTTLAMGFGWESVPLGHWLTHGGALVALVAACLGGIIAGVIHLCLILVRRVPENTFGMCSGRGAKEGSKGPQVLTDWLCGAINECAGLKSDASPLTFRDLSTKGVELRMITSNLSHGQPYVLPLETHIFLCNRKEMEDLFPEAVVKHLEAKQHISKRQTPPEGYFFLPPSEDLPVVVAMRMSLSFPLLISAVPLRTVKAKAYEGRKTGEKLVLKESDLQKNLFSDGGICSNFPIHFFDSWLPTRPTFGINLASMPNAAVSAPDATAEIDLAYASSLQGEADEGKANTQDVDGDGIQDKEVASKQDVVLSQPNEYVMPEWSPIEDLGTFVGRILDTALSYHDNAQTLLPSYRERIVHIRFADDQGGLNLAMDAKTVEDIKDKGKRAGEMVRDQFNFDHHRWVRFRVLMAQLEVQLQKMKTVLEPGDHSIRQFLNAATLNGSPKFPYPRSEKWCQDAVACVERLRALIGDWHPPEVFDANSPRPKPVLRVTPNF
jgi:predicted acylesterase/phospholipase RssA